MKLKAIAQYADGKPSDLTLKKEKKVIKHGNTFDIEDKARAEEILRTTFEGYPVAELVEEDKRKAIPAEEIPIASIEEVEEALETILPKQETKKKPKKKK